VTYVNYGGACVMGIRVANLVAMSVLMFGIPVAVAQESEAPALPIPPALAELPRDLSPWGMFVSADVLVKAVLLGLVFASLVTWTVWLAKTIELVLAKRAVARALKPLASHRLLTEAARYADPAHSPVGEFVAAASAELRLSSDFPDREGIKERIASRLERIESARARRILRGTGLLATIGATAPFVGLFGTVWGIMNSFIGISKSQTTNLAVVAPGIAEALLATAFGLAAAIPAVVIYNMFARQIAGYRASLGDASAEVLRLVSRDLDRSVVAPVSPVRRTMPLPAAE
jgi:biopolymer transport protein ExbB